MIRRMPYLLTPLIIHILYLSIFVSLVTDSTLYDWFSSPMYIFKFVFMVGKLKYVLLFWAWLMENEILFHMMFSHRKHETFATI